MHSSWSCWCCCWPLSSLRRWPHSPPASKPAPTGAPPLVQRLGWGASSQSVDAASACRPRRRCAERLLQAPPACLLPPLPAHLSASLLLRQPGRPDPDPPARPHLRPWRRRGGAGAGALLLARLRQPDGRAAGGGGAGRAGAAAPHRGRARGAAAGAPAGHGASRWPALLRARNSDTQNLAAVRPRDLSAALPEPTPSQQSLAEGYQLQPALAAPVAAAVDASYAAQAAIQRALQLGSREAVHPGGCGWARPRQGRAGQGSAALWRRAAGAGVPQQRCESSPSSAPAIHPQSTCLPRPSCAAAPWTRWAPRRAPGGGVVCSQADERPAPERCTAPPALLSRAAAPRSPPCLPRPERCAQWLALIVAGSFALALCCAACSALASLDKLGRVRGWW